MIYLKCLIITPFDASGKRVLDTIKRALQEIGVEALSFDDLPKRGSLLDLITDAIKKADFLIVDISRENPNVFYELGFAHALSKSTILITNDEAKGVLATDLYGFIYYVYEKNNYNKLAQYIKYSGKNIIEREVSRNE